MTVIKEENDCNQGKYFQKNFLQFVNKISLNFSRPSKIFITKQIFVKKQQKNILKSPFQNLNSLSNCFFDYS